MTRRQVVYNFTFLAIFFGFLFFYLYSLNYSVPANNIESFEMWLISLIGSLIYVLIFLGDYFYRKKVITPYNIFILFLVLFNYGHPLLWAFGIHFTHEIGDTTLYTLGVPTNNEIYITIIFIILMSMAFHLGYIVVNSKKSRKIKFFGNLRVIISDQKLFPLFKFLAIFIISITFIDIINNLIVSINYGYRFLYYGAENSLLSTLMGLTTHLFFPILLGLMVFSKFKKNIVYFVYAVFITYSFILFLTGDRGEWIYKLLILLIIHNSYVHKIKLRKLVLLFIVGYLALYVLNALVYFRNTEFSISNLISLIEYGNSPLLTAISQMGLSMRPTVVVIKYSVDFYPYGNTYLLGMIGGISERLFNFINFDYVNISSWFSQSYLQIDYGAGFSMFAEAYINYGFYFSMIPMFIFGFFIAHLNKAVDYSVYTKPMSIFLSFSLISAFITLPRNSLQGSLKIAFYSTISLLILLFILRKIKFSRHEGE